MGAWCANLSLPSTLGGTAPPSVNLQTFLLRSMVGLNVLGIKNRVLLACGEDGHAHANRIGHSARVFAARPRLCLLGGTAKEKRALSLKRSRSMRTAAALVAFMICAPACADDAPFQKPTAIELFKLRGMCAKLGDAFEYGGKGATPEVRWLGGGLRDLGPDVHFNEKDGHCYLKATFAEDDRLGCSAAYLLMPRLVSWSPTSS